MHLVGFLGLFIDDPEIDEETICGVDGQFEIRVADVEVEEAVLGGAEINELAAISTPSHAAAESGDFRKRRDPIRCAVEKCARVEFAEAESARAEFVTEFGGRETVGELALCGGVDQSAEKDEGFRAEWRGQIFIFTHPE